MDLYQQELIDHYRNPRNCGTLPHPDIASEQHNPSCGDSVCLQGKVSDSIVTELMFTGKGCVISQAAASMLTDYCKGKQIADIKTLDSAFMLQLIGMDLGPVRIKCALLALDALHDALKNS